MATNITTKQQQSRKRQRFSHAQKLLPNQQVEVRSVEEGFRGSWHQATVLECRTQLRVVKYYHSLCDNHSEEHIEFIPVSFAVDGKIPVNWQPSDYPNYRGKIRPMPPRVFHDNFCLRYGQCVDVYYGYAWWEGVVFDHDDGSSERLVFFPDMGDDLRIPVKNIRVTQDWDAASDEWKLRDDWILFEVVEEFKVEWPLSVSMKQIWYEVRKTNCFVREMKEWTCPIKERWKEIVKEVMVNNFKLTMLGFCHRYKLSEDLDIKKCFVDSMINLEPSFSESLVDGDLHSKLDMVLAIKSLYENLSFPTEVSVSKLTKTIDHCAVTRSSEVIKPDFSDISRNLESAISSPHMTEEPQTQDLHVIESEYCPQAVVDYHSLIMDSNFNLRKTEDSRFKNLQLSARKHLFAVGWSNFYLEDTSGRKELVYSSPNGRKFYNLHEACIYYFSEPSCFEIDNASGTNVGNVEDLIKKNISVLHSEKEVVKKDISLKTNHVKGSSKRARIGFPPIWKDNEGRSGNT
uniref:uncharacterized protein LOC122581573 n=1 Tax=Erigeron canadensis TaxID=72917 RepID=UPI001CB953E8|nr:uncharacterized protein LOC122581573 [Erigeron canadensis]